MPKSTAQIEKMASNAHKKAGQAERSARRTLRAQIEHAMQDDPEFLELHAEKASLTRLLHQTRLSISRKNMSIRAHQRKIDFRLREQQQLAAREHESSKRYDNICQRITRLEELAATRFTPLKAQQPSPTSTATPLPARTLTLMQA